LLLCLLLHAVKYKKYSCTASFVAERDEFYDKIDS
jgi:uncharacterized protein with NRDE domain